MDLESLLGLLAGLGIPTAIAGWCYRVWSGKVRVRRVTDPNDEELDEAFALYDRRIPDPNLRDSSNDIRRWLGELRDEKAAATAELDDYLLVAKTRTGVCGFFYGQFYPKSGFLFVSYLVADEQTATSRKDTTRKIGEYLKRELRRTLQGCRAVVFELAAPSPTERETWLLRFRCFARMAGRAGVTIKRLDIPYVQPRLSPLDDSYKEEPQFLFYGCANAAPLGATVSRDEVVVPLLRALYTQWYAQAFERDPSTEKEYLDYLQKLFARVVDSIPSTVAALDHPSHPRPTRQSDAGVLRESK
jgi:hypothetical protein